MPPISTVPALVFVCICDGFKRKTLFHTLTPRLQLRNSYRAEKLFRLIIFEISLIYRKYYVYLTLCLFAYTEQNNVLFVYFSCARKRGNFLFFSAYLQFSISGMSDGSEVPSGTPSATNMATLHTAPSLYRETKITYFKQ